MCGIVGVFSYSTLVYGEEKLFDQLLYVDALRGDDSFGVIKVNSKKEVTFYKSAFYQPQTAPWFDKVYQNFRKENGIKLLVGHNRAATAGKVTDENAHPFQHGHITMVHNGTLRESFTGFQVDSDWLCHQLSKCADDKEIAAFLGKLNGAYALAWWNSKTQRFYLAHNNERPLYMCKFMGCVFFASEGKMLEWILHRNKHSGFEIKPVPEHKILSFTMSYNGEEEIEIPKKSVAYDMDDMYGCGYGMRWGQNNRSTVTLPAKGTTQTQSTQKPTEGNVVSLISQARKKGAETQHVIAEIDDWWPMHDQKTTDSEGKSVQSFCVRAHIEYFVESYNAHLGYKEKESLLFFGIPETKLDSLLGVNTTDPNKDHTPYVTAMLGDSRGRIHITTLRKPLDGSSVANFASFKNPLSHTDKQFFPKINQADISSVRSMSGIIGKSGSVADVDGPTWSLVLDDKEISRAKSDHKKMLDQEAEDLEKLADAVNGIEKKNPPSPCCARCRTPTPSNKELYVVGTEAVCDACYAVVLS